MADQREESPDHPEADASAPVRIKRNTACVRCRDAKVRCNASQTSNRSCIRCSKLGLDCVVDKGHKRTSRKSKLEELFEEVRTIKKAVGNGSPSTLSQDVADPQPTHIPSPLSDQQGLGSVLPPMRTPSVFPVMPPVPTMVEQPLALQPNFSSRPSPRSSTDARHIEPRALGSRVFSSEDIAYYFDKYFEHFHPYLPIIRNRDPDICYKLSPILFWVILATSCRRFAKDDVTLKFLSEYIRTEIWAAVSRPPLHPYTINALLLSATWPLPDIRFFSDPSAMLCGIAINACYLLGLNTGRGSLPELINQNIYSVNTTDEEATFTWAACTIIAPRVTAYMGCPPITPISSTVVDRIIDGTTPFMFTRHFRILLETAVFSSRLNRAMMAVSEDGRGVPEYLVANFEDEFSRLHRLLTAEATDLDKFIVQAALLEIQLYYFIPLHEHNREALKRNIMRCYTTAESLINLATKLDAEAEFLKFAPHFIFRWLLAATCVVFITNFSAIIDNEQKQGGDALVRIALATMRSGAVQTGDLHVRGVNMLELYWTLRHRLTQSFELNRPVLVTNRLGASIAFDCIRRWKKDIDELQAATNLSELSSDPTQTPALMPGRNAELGLPNPLQRFDWNSFTDDFDWSFTSGYLNVA